MPIYCLENDFSIQQETLAAHGLDTFLNAYLKGCAYDARNKEAHVTSAVISTAAEALYCGPDSGMTMPIILARLWKAYLTEIYERAEASPDELKDLLHFQQEACSIVKEMTEAMPDVIQNWKSWEELDAEAEAELEALNEE